MRWQQRLPLTAVVFVIALTHVALGAGLAVLLLRWSPPWMAVAGATLCALPSLVWSLQRAFAPSHALFRALAGTVASYRDSDYGFGVTWQGRGALGELVAAHNELGETLRAQRLSLVQRELLLDTMVQNTPVAMLLLDPADRVVHANLAARRALGGGRKLEGQMFSALLADAPPALADAFARGGDGLFTIGDGESEEIHHLSRRHFRLNGRRHELLLLRQMTTELRRQEVQTWKKVIASSATNSTIRWRRSPRSPTRAPNCCAAGKPRVCRTHCARSRNARGIWKASSAATRISPSCRRLDANRCAGAHFSTSCGRRCRSWMPVRSTMHSPRPSMLPRSNRRY